MFITNKLSSVQFEISPNAAKRRKLTDVIFSAVVYLYSVIHVNNIRVVDEYLSFYYRKTAETTCT